MTVSPRLATGTSSAMTGGAVVAVEYDHVGRANRLARLRSDGPFRVRPGGSKGFEPWTGGARDVARVAVSAATAGPLGGDRLAFEVAVGDGATLVLVDTSATLVLPGVHGEPSRVDYRVRVGDDATLIWASEPLIAASGCDHTHRIEVTLAPRARFFLRDELIAGRVGEPSGNLSLQIRVTRDGTALFDQRLGIGPGHPGWDSPAVVGNAKAVGTMLIVDPGSTIGVDRADLIGADGVSVGIADDVVAAGAVAADSLALSRTLDRAIALVGSPWGPEPGASATISEETP